MVRSGRDAGGLVKREGGRHKGKARGKQPIEQSAKRKRESRDDRRQEMHRGHAPVAGGRVDGAICPIPAAHVLGRCKESSVLGWLNLFDVLRWREIDCGTVTS